MTKEQVRATALEAMSLLGMAHEHAIAAYWTQEEFHIDKMFKYWNKAAGRIGYKLVKVEDGEGEQT